MSAAPGATVPRMTAKLPIAAAAFAALATILTSLAIEASRPRSGQADAWVPVAQASAPLPLPMLRLDWSATDGLLRLSGTVPDGWEHDALLRRARALYGEAAVRDELTTAAVANPAWLSPAFVPDLRAATRATAVLTDARLVIDAEAPADPVRRRLNGQLAAFRDYGLAVEARIAVR